MPPSRPLDWAGETLLADERAGLLRRLRRREGGSEPRGEVDGRKVVVFSSNDYLGLPVHPAVREAASRAALELGGGSTGSRHLSGGHRALDDLEGALAGFLRAPRGTAAPPASLTEGCGASRPGVPVSGPLGGGARGARLDVAEGRPIIVTDSVF